MTLGNRKQVYFLFYATNANLVSFERRSLTMLKYNLKKSIPLFILIILNIVLSATFSINCKEIAESRDNTKKFKVGFSLLQQAGTYNLLSPL